MTLSDMRGRVSARLNEGGAPTFYPSAEIDARIGEAQRTFVLLTLALEQTSNWTIPAGTPFIHMLPFFPDWIVNLRIALVSGTKIRPAELNELTANDSGWMASPGTPSRYAPEGSDLIALDHQPTAPLVVSLTYARAPHPLVADADVPEIPANHHPLLVGYAINAIRQVEGGQEWEKTLPLLNDFLDGAVTYGDYIRDRNKGARYDAVPYELAKHDRKDLLRMMGGK